MRLTASQHAAVTVRVEFARSELADLGDYGDLDWVSYQRDAKARRNVERIAENVANAVIDIAKILLSASGGGVPGTYREVLEATLAAGLASGSTTDELVRLAELRNALAHPYLDYKWEGLKWFLRPGSAAVRAWLDESERTVAAPR